MKIRTDFVTNSSSSSYCVSLGVDQVGKKKSISLDLWPDGEDGSGDVWVGMRTELDEFIEQVKACSTVEELKSVLVEFLDFEESIEELDIEDDDTNADILRKLAEMCDTDSSEEEEDDDWGDDEGEYAAQIVETYTKFQSALDKIASLSEIKSITVTEYFTGWGEFARDGVDDFMCKAIPEELDWDDEDAVKDALKDRFKEGEIEAMIDQVQNDSICQFNASIDTTINIATGTVTRKYSFDAD